MAFRKAKVSPEVQQRLETVAAELRELLYGAAGYPEWGTKFREIEAEGMSVGLELARLVMEQSVSEQAKVLPPGSLSVAEDSVLVTGTEEVPLETEAGIVHWDQPRGYLKKGRKAFFPPAARSGTGGG
jgi:hypothetical protein